MFLPFRSFVIFLYRFLLFLLNTFPLLLVLVTQISSQYTSPIYFHYTPFTSSQTISLIFSNTFLLFLHNIPLLYLVSPFLFNKHIYCLSIRSFGFFKICRHILNSSRPPFTFIFTIPLPLQTLLINIIKFFCLDLSCFFSIYSCLTSRFVAIHLPIFLQYTPQFSIFILNLHISLLIIQFIYIFNSSQSNFDIYLNIPGLFLLNTFHLFQVVSL